MPDRNTSDRGPVERESTILTTGAGRTPLTSPDRQGVSPERSGTGRAVVTDAAPQQSATLPDNFGQSFFPYRGQDGAAPFINAPGTVNPEGLIPVLNPAPGNQSGVVGTVATYGADDPFSILADVFLRGFGNDDSGEPKQGPVVVGDAGFSQGSSNSGLGLFVVVLVIGGGVAYYYWRKRRASN